MNKTVIKKSHSALLAWADYRRTQDLIAICNELNTYEAAIEEVFNLRIELEQSKINHAMISGKKQRGRPTKSNTTASGMFGIFDNKPKPITKSNPVGAPVKHTPQEMITILKTIDDDKKLYGYKTDKDFIAAMMQAMGKNKNIPDYKMKEIVRIECKELKYFRDETGIRQKRKTKK